MFFAPKFTKGRDIFIIRSQEFFCDTEDAAQEAGVGPGLMFSVRTGSRFTGEILEVPDGDQFFFVPAKLGKYPIMVIDGPEFQRRVASNAEEAA